ncbi:Breast cancer anti-estrogen resistance protein 3 [Varanus komodoensis]|nr:Breast cancer anti-estrogen resistance protein 3 [Varanus komodoensis]
MQLETHLLRCLKSRLLTSGIAAGLGWVESNSPNVGSLKLQSCAHLLRELRMIAAGKFASLPRNMQMNHEFSLASSMDLLSSKPSLASEHRSNTCNDVSIHGTLPRKKKGTVPIGSNDAFSHMGMLPYSKLHRPQGILIQEVIEEYPQKNWNNDNFHRDQNAMDPAMEYVKFSKERNMEQQVMENSPEKLKKELEEELQMSGEDLRSHAWYHGRIPRQVAESLVQRDGDFLIRDSLSSPGNFVLTCQWKNISQHFKINKTVLRLNESYCRVQYHFEDESFDSIPGLVRCYVGNRRRISKQSGAIIFQPINRTVPLRCLEEKYSVSPILQREGSVTEGQGETPKRLSLNLCNRQAREQNSIRGNLLRNKEKSGSHPACLDHVQEKRFPPKAQSESYLPIGVPCPAGVSMPLPCLLVCSGSLLQPVFFRAECGALPVCSAQVVSTWQHAEKKRGLGTGKDAFFLLLCCIYIPPFFLLQGTHGDLQISSPLHFLLPIAL